MCKTFSCNCTLPSLTGSTKCCEHCLNNPNRNINEEIAIQVVNTKKDLDLYNDECHLEDLENEKYNRPSWQDTFVEVAKVISKRSKDPHTKVGAVLVKNNCIIGTGYNGDPRNFRYDFDWSTPEKYDYCIHAEMNAIANATYNGAGNSIKGSDIYVTLSPCNKCILQLIQFGVKRVFYLTEYKDFELTKKIADNADIELIKI